MCSNIVYVDGCIIYHGMLFVQLPCSVVSHQIHITNTIMKVFYESFIVVFVNEKLINRLKTKLIILNQMAIVFYFKEVG